MAASDRFRIVVKGRQTHGSRPWGGVDPIVVAAQIVIGLQTHRRVARSTSAATRPWSRVGAIKGGIRNNIIPDEVEMIGTFRTFDPAVRQQIIERITRTAQDIAQLSGRHGDGRDRRGQQPRGRERPDADAAHAAVAARASPAGSGRASRCPTSPAPRTSRSSAQRVPSLFFFVGSTPAGIDGAQAPSNHSPLFYLDEGSLPVGLRAMMGVAVDYLQGTKR